MQEPPNAAEDILISWPPQLPKAAPSVDEVIEALIDAPLNSSK